MIGPILHATLKHPSLLSDLRRTQLAHSKLQSKLRGDDSMLNLAADTLQMRLLSYLETHLGLKDGKAMLIKIEKTRKELREKLQREGLLGLHADNKELLPLVKNFSDYHLYVLNNAIFADDTSESFKNPEVVEIFSQKLQTGRGADLITYVAKRLKLHEKRLASEQPYISREVFNAGLTIAVELWTDSRMPLWMMPSKGAVSIINGILKEWGAKPITKENFDTLIRAHKNELVRLDATIGSKLISAKKTKDTEGVALQKEFAIVMGIALSSVRRGARPKVAQVN